MAGAAFGGTDDRLGEARRVLIVEDNPVETVIVRSFLEASDGHFHLSACATLAEAVESLRAAPFDAVVLDLSLPDASGFEGLSRLLLEVPGVAIVVLTGTACNATGEAAVRLGAEDYLVKDEFDGRLLARSLRYAIERHRSRASMSPFEAALNMPVVDVTAAATARMLRDALDHEHLRLAYQPIVDLRSSAMVGVEALLRIDDPDAASMAIEDVIAVAEHTGLITSVGRWVLRAATEQAARWRSLANASPLRTAINVSARQLDLPTLTDEIIHLISRANLPTESIAIELTETVLVESGRAGARCLEALRSRGIAIGLDDFGTGYSSLRYLRDLPIDFVKLDQGFVERLPDDQETSAIVGGITRMLHDLGLTVVAEGVESTHQAAFLRATGCDLAQGYFFGRPAPPSRITAQLAQSAEVRTLS